MTNVNADSANNTGLPKTKTLTQCQHDAVVLSGMIEAIDLMGNEGEQFDCARVSVTMEALEKAKRLAVDLDEVAS